MFGSKILLLFLAFAFTQEVRSNCWWRRHKQPGAPNQENEQPKCLDKEDAYQRKNEYWVACDDGVIDLDMKPCYLEHNGIRTGNSYVYALNIFVVNGHTHDLFAQNLNSYSDLKVSSLHINGHKDHNLTTVPQQIFDLNHLENLDLTRNKIKEIQITAFARMPELKSLDLSLNEISDLNPIPVDARSNATHISLNSNRIKTLQVDFLYYFPKVEILDVKENNIESVTITDFEGVMNLKNLDLSKNKLTTINGDGFKRLSLSLEIFRIDFNSISRFPSKNDLTFPNLQMLFASFNQIEELDNLEIFPKNDLIQLSYNKITKITKDMFKSTGELQWIRLDNNPISEIESNSFENNRKLFNIDMRNISLVSIEGSQFYGYNYENQKIEYREIDLSGGKIRYIGNDAFTGVTGLLRLLLSSNAIEKISNQAFNTLHSLKMLDLSHNQLQKISKPLFENLIALNDLDLSYNNIKEIDSNAFANQNRINNLKFSNNEEFEITIETHYPIVIKLKRRH